MGGPQVRPLFPGQRPQARPQNGLQVTPYAHVPPRAAPWTLGGAGGSLSEAPSRGPRAALAVMRARLAHYPPSPVRAFHAPGRCRVSVWCLGTTPARERPQLSSAASVTRANPTMNERPAHGRRTRARARIPARSPSTRPNPSRGSGALNADPRGILSPAQPGRGPHGDPRGSGMAGP